MKNLYFDNFIETSFYKADLGKEPVSVNEFLIAMAYNDYYNCGYSIGFEKDCEKIYDKREETDSKYRSSFVDDLKDVDDNIAVDNIVPVSLARICTPSFMLICKNGREISVKSFASFYEDSYFSITHIYHDLNLVFSFENKNNLANWSFISKIRIDENIAKILNLAEDDQIKKELGTKGYTDISIEKFHAATFHNKFGIGAFTVQKSLHNLSKHMDGLKYTRGGHIIMPHEPFAYMMLYTDINPKKISIIRLENIIYQGEDIDFQNKELRDVGVDLSADSNCITRGYFKFMYSLCSERLDPEKLIINFALFDACYLEKIKYIEAIREIRHLVYYSNDKEDYQELLASKYHYLRTAKDSIIYEYKEEFSLTVNAIRRSLGLFLYEREYKNICQVAEEVIVKQKELDDLSRDRKRTNAINVLTIILAVPSVTAIVDIFYGLNIFNSITWTANKAKLIWIVITLCVSLIYFSFDSINKIVKNSIDVKAFRKVIRKLKQLIKRD